MRCIGLLVGLVLVSVVGAEERVAYSNLGQGGTFVAPGRGEFVAEDMAFEGGPCYLASVQFETFSRSSGKYSVEMELWDGDPCSALSTAIAGTRAVFEDLEPNAIWELTAFADAPLALPWRAWLRVVFSEDDAGLLTKSAASAETGLTALGLTLSGNAQGCEVFLEGLSALVELTCADTECDRPKDTDGDGDIDLKDFAVFQRCFMGPG